MATDKTVAINITSKNTASPQIQQVNKELQALGGHSKTAGGHVDDLGKKAAAAGGHMQKGMFQGLTGVNALQAGLAGAGQNMLGMQMAMFGVGAAAVGMGVLITKSAVDAGISYESAFAGVRKTVDATEQEFAQFNAEIRRMAKDIPASREEIARVAEAAGQLGIQKDALMGFTRTMVDLGNTTNLSSDAAATALARLANITQMPQENFDRLGSTVVDLGNKFASTEQEIVAMGLRLAGAGTTVGMTEAQILSFATALSSVGVEAEMGGSAFSRVMLNIKAEADSGGVKLATFAKVAGMSVDDFTKRFRTDAAGAIVAFVNGLGRMQAEGGNVIGVLDDLDLSEIRVRDALLRASNAGDLFTRALDVGSRAWEENTALTKEAEERYKTTASKIEVMKNKFSDLGVELFERTKPRIHGVIDALANMASSIETRALPALDDMAKKSNELFKVQREHNWLIMLLRGGIESLNDAIEANNRLQKTLGERVALAAVGMDLMASHTSDAADAMWNLSRAILSVQGIELAAPQPQRYGVSPALKEPQEIANASRLAVDLWEAKKERMEREEQALKRMDPLTARLNQLIAEGKWETIRAEMAAAESWEAKIDRMEREAEARKEAESERKKGAGEAKRDVEALERALERADEEAIELAEDMGNEAARAIQNVARIGEEGGRKWIEAWFQVDRQIKEVGASAEKALRTLDESEFISQSSGARRKGLDERLTAEDKAHRERVENEEALWRLNLDLGRAKTEDEKKRIRERYAEWLVETAHRRQIEGQEAEWRKYLEGERAKLERELHQEEVDRRRAAIIAERDEKITAINAEWVQKQARIADETKTLQAAEVARAKAKLAAIKENYFKELPAAAQGAIDELRARLEAAFGAAIAMISGGGGDGDGYGGPGWGAGGTILPNPPPNGTPWATPGPGISPIIQMPTQTTVMDAAGVVPGPWGSPRLVMARGGEEFGGFPPRGGGITVNVYVQGSVTAERDLAMAIRDRLLEVGRRNLSVGLA